MPEAYLALWLEAPLQSWGFDSKFYRRDTLDFPTRSGVLGLLCCAMGAGGSQTEWLAQMAGFKQAVHAFGRKGEAEQPKLEDFHMVGSGYDEKDPWQNLLIPKTVDRKKAVGGGTKMTYRYYLQDQTFGVVVAVPAEQAEGIARALKNPVWDLYLGRKCCVPTDVIYRGTFDAESKAVEALQGIARDKGLIERFEVQEGSLPDLGDVLMLNDVPVSFGDRKVYRERSVTIIPKEIPEEM